MYIPTMSFLEIGLKATLPQEHRDLYEDVNGNILVIAKKKSKLSVQKIDKWGIM